MFVSATQEFLLVAGPCVLENEELAIEIAKTIQPVAKELGWKYVFKASYDKANRTSSRSPRGPGLQEGVKMLDRVKSAVNVPVITDVHSVEEVAAVARHVDMIQIPAFLCRQTDLIQAAGWSGCAVNVKKGQFISPFEVNAIAEKLKQAGCEQYWITERGTSFGYQNLVVDMRSFVWMKENGHRVIFDATHSVQRPGGHGDRTGGDGWLAPALARGAVAVGVDGVFVETHPCPEKSPSDGDNMIPLADLPEVLRQLNRIQHALKPS